jgi:triacylglycerol lipase
MTIAVYRVLLLAFASLFAAPGLRAAEPLVAPASQANTCVVLLHGLGRTYRSMFSIEYALRDAGYATISVDYPSQDKPIETLAMQAVPEGLAHCRERGATTIHFVTHSMGGLVLRYYLSTHRVPELGRVVMLSPPNQGSEVADTLVGTAVYDRVNGPAGGQLVTGPDGIAARLGPVDFPLGIITGNQQTVFDSVLATQIPGANDGKVSVERAKVEGMSDFLVLPVTHTFIVNNDEVIGQTLYFLANGTFRHSGATGSMPAQAPVTHRK